jgi:hypothetical protein
MGVVLWAIALHGVMDIVYIFHILLIPSFLHNLCYKVSITLLIFLHILLDHTSLLNCKKKHFLFTIIFSYCRVMDQHPQTYRIEHLNLYLNTFLKWQACLKFFRCLRTVLSHYINISSLEMDYYIPITENRVTMIFMDDFPLLP